MMLLIACSVSNHLSVYRLYFGMRIDSINEVSETEFKTFLDTAITRRFPDGLTIYSGKGQWKSGGRTLDEKSKIVEIAASPGKDLDKRISDVRENYKKIFHQESVMLVVQRAKVTF